MMRLLSSAGVPAWSQWVLVIGAIVGAVGAIVGVAALMFKFARVIFRIEEALPTLLVAAERMQKEDLWKRLDEQDRQIAQLHTEIADLKTQLQQVQAGTVNVTSTPSGAVLVTPVATPSTP